jgi:DNA repair exonuclease SbcCD nuclease subunit
MLSQIVDRALQEKVDAVAISGDLVDKENKFHEAYGPVERGLKRLAAAEIDVFAVSGNHDFDVLPRLSGAVGAERFHFLGRGGTWERKALMRNGSRALDIIGWSFPSEYVPENPMRTFASLAQSAAGAVPTLGLLHADLDQPDSRYAPVALGELQSAGVSGWLLGHVHRPRWIAQNGSAAVLYPGSPQAMDPGENGAHGPWMMEIDSAGGILAWQVPMSLVRYESIDIDMTGIETKEGFDAHVPRELRRQLTHACQSCGPLEMCSVRIRLTGATSLHAELKAHCREATEQIQLSIDPFIVRVEQITIDTRPPVDLRDLARGSSVASDLARLLLQLGDDADGSTTATADVASLVAAAGEMQEALCSTRAYQPLSPAEYPVPQRSQIRASLHRQGMWLLETLLEQKRVAAGDT